MILTRPQFSIVIPTFNRARLLKFAIESALSQSFDDFEIVVSNGGSEDDTAEVVRSFDDSRIKYFESSGRIPVGENYQQGLNNAKGEYITFLSDDDAYTPELLSKTKSVVDETGAKLLAYQYCRYYHSDVQDFDTDIPGNSLLIQKYDSGVSMFSARDAIDQMLATSSLIRKEIDGRFIAPYLSNAVYHRQIFEDLAKKRSELFDFVPPDYYLTMAVLYNVNAYFCLDMPLLVWSNWDGNTTVTASRTQNRQRDHYRRMLHGRKFKFTPLDIASALNCGAECVLQAVRDFANESPTIDWDHFFWKNWENFSFLRSQGVDVSEEVKEFEKTLAAQPEFIRREVNHRRSSPKFRGKSFVNENFPSLASLGRRLLRNRSTSFNLVRGDSKKFENVAEAARFVFENANIKT